jgi:hypothetical protein
VSLPGPAFGPWAIALLLGAAGIGIVGEVVRAVAGRYAPWARTLRPIERLLVDLYLGGGVLFVLAALPLDLFYAATPAALIAAGVVLLALLALRRWRRGELGSDLRTLLHSYKKGAIAVGLLSTLGLFLVEVATATTVPTGNTFDSSLLTYYVAHLELGHTIPLNFLPAAAFGNPYPQGTTAWLAAFQSLFGLPPARTSLLVTPLFLALAPLGAYTVGDRLLDRPWAGATFAVVFAFVASWTRVLVGGSNDFALAFPLVLLLFARAAEWGRPALPGWPDVVFFGGLAGVATSLNPAGPIWLFLSILGLGVGFGLFTARRRIAWLARWALAALLAAAFAIPSLFVEVTGANGLFRGGLPTGAVAPPTGTPGISTAQFIGLVDPFLLRPTDVWLSPFPPIRDELAGLIGLGAVVLVLALLRPSVIRGLGEFPKVVLVGTVGAWVILLGGLGLGHGLGALAPLFALTSYAETSILLFAMYSLLAALPVFLLVEYALRLLKDRGGTPWVHEPGTGGRRRGRAPAGDRWAPAVLALTAAGLLIVPGIAVTAAQLPAYETDLYRAFGNVSSADLDLLEWAGAHLPSGARVLVAPGSAAGFLPGYAPRAVVLYPMIDGVYVNASYRLLVRELSNGTLDAAGSSALASLTVGFVAVTGNNTELYRPFLPAPLLADPAMSVAFHEQDAYLFEVTAPRG